MFLENFRLESKMYIPFPRKSKPNYVTFIITGRLVVIIVKLLRVIITMMLMMMMLMMLTMMMSGLVLLS